VDVDGLVVGGTRILRPLVVALAARGDRIAVVARGREALARLAAEVGVEPLAVDYSDEEALARTLGGRRFDYAVAYMPSATAAGRGIVARCSDRVVHVLPSAFLGSDVGEEDLAAAAPAGRLRTTRLLLGWAETPAGTRWHDAAEISQAAVAALDERPGVRVLGVGRPAANRPS